LAGCQTNPKIIEYFKLQIANQSPQNSTLQSCHLQCKEFPECIQHPTDEDRPTMPARPALALGLITLFGWTAAPSFGDGPPPVPATRAELKRFLERA